MILNLFFNKISNNKLELSDARIKNFLTAEKTVKGIIYLKNMF